MNNLICFLKNRKFKIELSELPDWSKKDAKSPFRAKVCVFFESESVFVNLCKSFGFDFKHLKAVSVVSSFAQPENQLKTFESKFFYASAADSVTKVE